MALPLPTVSDPEVQRAFDVLGLAVPSRVFVVTALPTSPSDGYEVYYVADATNGVVWHLRYRAASASAYKWEVLGGPPLYGEVTTDELRNSSTFGDLATVGPTVTLPLGGDYLVAQGAEMYADTVGVQLLMSYAIGATTASDDDASQVAAHTVNNIGTGYRERRKNGLGAVALTAKYRNTPLTANPRWRRRWMRATPVRVG